MPTLTHWVTLSNFMGLHPIPTTWIYLGTSTPMFGMCLSQKVDVCPLDELRGSDAECSHELVSLFNA